ncbi:MULTISPECIES: lipopolysaccharide biosynthesis protein [Bacteria]
MNAESARDDAAGTRRVARGGLANLVGAGYAGLASFAITVLVTRISSIADAGVYFSAVSVLLIAVALCQLGTPVGYVYFLARYRALGEVGGLRKILIAGAIPVAALGIVLSVVALVFHAPFGTLLFGSNIVGRGTIVAVLASCLLIAIAADSVLGATRGMGVMRPTVVADKFVSPTIQLLALVLLALAGWTGGDELIWTRIVGFVAVVVIGVPWLAKLLRKYPRETRSKRKAWIPNRAIMAEFWRFTAPRAVGQIAQTGIQRVDIILVALWAGPAEAAVYAAATRFLVFGQLAGHAIGMAVQPRFSTLAARNDFSALQRLYRTSTAWIILATWPFYLTFFIHADLLMLVFGDQYEGGAVVLQILAAAMLVATGCGVVDAVLLMAGRSVLTMINSWVALSLNIGLNIWLIPQIGIVGAAVAWVAAILATNVVPLVQVRVTLGVHPFGRVTLLAAAVAAFLFGVIPGVAKLIDGSIITGAVCFAAAALVYAALLWRWRRRLGVTDLLGRGARKSLRDTSRSSL